jgi:CheY-specific phosphatase CheX
VQIFDDESGGMTSAELQATNLDESVIIEEVSTSVQHVFSTTLGLEVTIGSASMDQPAGEAGESVLSLIGWSGTWKGTGMLSCAPRFACRIASLMLGTEYDSPGPDVLDAVGEMANMIFGNVKTNLEGVLGAMELSIPTVLYGNSLSVRSMVRKAISIPVIADGNTLIVKVHMEPDTKHRVATTRLCVNVDFTEISAAGSL